MQLVKWLPSKWKWLLEPEVEISEDPENVVGDLTEAPNPSSEEFVNASVPSLASEGKPRTWTHYFIYTAIYIYIYTCALSS
jgi:hypothetical protein